MTSQNLSEYIESLEEKNIAEMAAYLATLTQDDDVEKHITLIAIHISEYIYRLPTRFELATVIFNLRNCGCIDHIPQLISIRIIDRLISWKMIVWECDVIMKVYEYFVTHSRMPSLDELIEFTNTLEQFHNDQVAFAARDRVIIGVDISGYKSQDDTPNTTCALCYGDITTQNYKLPCGHRFHYIAEECLGETVARWFEKNTKCPMCRVDMRDHGAREISDRPME